MDKQNQIFSSLKKNKSRIYCTKKNSISKKYDSFNNNNTFTESLSSAETIINSNIKNSNSKNKIKKKVNFGPIETICVESFKNYNHTYKAYNIGFEGEEDILNCKCNDCIIY